MVDYYFDLNGEIIEGMTMTEVMEVVGRRYRKGEKMEEDEVELG